jgi:hypothetical protein
LKFLDPDHPMFSRRWVRWATVLVPLTWGGVEASVGAWVWAGLFWAIAGYAFFVLILRR